LKGKTLVVVTRLWLACAVCAALPVLASAQEPDTRAAEIAQAQAEKSRDLKPYTRNIFERRLFEIEQAGGLAIQRGFFVTFGDIKQGSSVALGPAYGKLFDNGTLIVGKATYSIRNFKLLQVYASAPPMARGRLTLSGRVRWQDAPELAVYALGPDSPKVRADYSETKTEISAQAELRPVRFIRLGAGVAFERYDTAGADTTRSSVEEMFTRSEMPGIFADPDYVHSFVAAGLDTRSGVGYSRSGTLIHAALHDYRQRNTASSLSSDARDYSFQRVDAVARQLIPILHGNWVIDLSVRTSTTTVDDGNVVPFFLLPDLGGAGELRGYSSYRFRDRNSIIFTGEYRWYVQEFVDMAIFYDGGKVAARRGDLDFDRLKSNVGIGIRFHGPQTTALRLEVAKGNEGVRLIFAFSAPVR
jgi:hypothetical protein